MPNIEELERNYPGITAMIDLATTARILSGARAVDFSYEITEHFNVATVDERLSVWRYVLHGTDKKVDT